MEPSLGDRLQAEHDTLLRFVRRHGTGLSRFESPEDLTQGIIERALAGSRPDSEAPEAFRAWLFQVARRHMADRSDYWRALKREAPGVVRLTLTGQSRTGVATGISPAADVTGPGTFAARRELVLLATRTLSTLPERDRQLVGWLIDGVPLATQSERLGLSYAATQRAAHRSIERLRAAFRVLGA